MDKNLQYTISLKDLFSKTMGGVINSTNKLDSNFSKLQSKISRLENVAGGYLAFNSLKSGISSIISATSKMQGFNNAIMASSSSELEGSLNLAFLNKQVDRLGLNLDAAKSGYKTFTGAVMGSSIQGMKANKIFRQVSEASAVLGLSAEQTEGSFLALGQMVSKGTVSAEELRGQLAERIPGAFQIGARAMGMTTKQLGEAMKKGLVDSTEFLEKFGNELEKTFGAKLEKSTHSLQSNLNRMDSAWDRLKVNIGNSQSGIINGTVNFASNLVGKLNEITSSANRMDEAFANAKVSNYSWLQNLNNWIFAGSTNDFINNNFTGGKGKMEMLNRSVQSMYVDPASRDKMSALQSDAGLKRLKLGYDKAFLNKEITKDEYTHSLALFDAGLKAIKGNLSMFSSSKQSNMDSGLTENGGKSPFSKSSLGTGTEVTGNKPSSLNITINGGLVAQMDIHSTTINEVPSKVKEMVGAALAEAVNDINRMDR